jgi:hypothetical protein
MNPQSGFRDESVGQRIKTIKQLTKSTKDLRKVIAHPPYVRLSS